MNNWDHAYLTEIQGKVQEEELDSWRAAGERGPEARLDEGAGRNQHGFSLHDFGAKKRGTAQYRPSVDE
jgi:hypothetical protein